MSVDISPKRPPISSCTADAPTGSGSDGGGSSVCHLSIRRIIWGLLGALGQIRVSGARARKLRFSRSYMGRHGNVNNLATYLNEHLAGSTNGREIAPRGLSHNGGTQCEPTLEWLVEQIVEDRQALLGIMRAVGAPEDHLKKLAAFAVERVGRLKPNNALFSYSPLSRLVEFEGLVLGVTGKIAAWRSLQQLDDPRLAAFDLEQLAQRSLEQRDRVEEQRRAAARLAFD